MENRKQPPDLHIFHSVGCLEKLIKKLNITVITILETDLPQEATLSQVVNSYIGNWTRNVGQIVLLSESYCSLVLYFAKCTSDFIFQVSVTLNTTTIVQYLSEKKTGMATKSTHPQ